MLEIAQMQHSKLLMTDLDEETSHTTYTQACKFEQYRSMGLSTIIFSLITLHIIQGFNAPKC